MNKCTKCSEGEVKQFTVRKEGKNQGRTFYSCSNKGGCDYFMWGDKGGSPELQRPARESKEVPSKKGLEYTQNKDRRIAWLSVFSSLCRLNQGKKESQEIEEEAYGVVEEIYIRYPFPSDEPFE